MDALKGTPAKGYLLEMFFIFKCDMALATITDETPASWTVKAESFLKEKKDERFTIKFRKRFTKKSKKNFTIRFLLLVILDSFFRNFCEILLKNN